MTLAIRRSATLANARWTPAFRRYGGFDHNAQALAVVTRLERRYAAFDGLNLTWETLEGLVKHNGPLTDHAGGPLGKDPKPLPRVIVEYCARQDLELWSFPERRGTGGRDCGRHCL